MARIRIIFKKESSKRMLVKNKDGKVISKAIHDSEIWEPDNISRVAYVPSHTFLFYTDDHVIELDIRDVRHFTTL